MAFVPKDTSRMSDDEKQAYIDSLEDQLAAFAEGQTRDGIINLRRLFGLSASEAEVLCALVDGRVHSAEWLLTVLTKGAAEAPESKVVNVFVSRIRSKVRGSAIKISTLWGEGYHVEDPEPLRKAMAGEFVPGEAEEYLPGRPAGRYGKGHGEVRDAALGYLRGVSKDGVAYTTGRALSEAIGSGAPGATVLRNLAGRGHIEILKKPNRGGLWRVRVVS